MAGQIGMLVGQRRRIGVANTGLRGEMDGPRDPGSRGQLGQSLAIGDVEFVNRNARCRELARSIAL